MTVGAGSTGAAASSTGPAVARSADQEGHRGHLIRSLPEWIGDEQAVATRRRHQGHEENAHHLEVKRLPVPGKPALTRRPRNGSSLANLA